MLSATGPVQDRSRHILAEEASRPVRVSKVKSIVPHALSRAGRLPAANAVDGMDIVPGRVSIAPPDHFLLLGPGRIRVTRGPKENRFRPAVDPLFRSAAYAFGPRVVGWC